MGENPRPTVFFEAFVVSPIPVILANRFRLQVIDGTVEVNAYFMAETLSPFPQPPTAATAPRSPRPSMRN
jgi:hypothetical protein